MTKELDKIEPKKAVFMLRCNGNKVAVHFKVTQWIVHPKYKKDTDF